MAVSASAPKVYFHTPFFILPHARSVCAHAKSEWLCELPPPESQFYEGPSSILKKSVVRSSLLKATLMFYLHNIIIFMHDSSKNLLKCCKVVQKWASRVSKCVKMCQNVVPDDGKKKSVFFVIFLIQANSQLGVSWVSLCGSWGIFALPSSTFLQK